MLKQFLTHKTSILPFPADINVSLHWNTRTDALPLCAYISGEYYLLAGNTNSKAVMSFNATDTEEALKISLTTADPSSITFTEWLKIYRISSNTFENLPLSGFAKKETALISEAAAWNNDIINYLEKKPASVSILKLISLLSVTQKDLLADYIRKENPSVQQFKTFTEGVRDFNLETGTYIQEDFKKLTERRTQLHIKADNLMKNIPFARNGDNFETSAITWSFTAKNINEFKKMLEKLNNSMPEIDELFKLLNDGE